MPINFHDANNKYTYAQRNAHISWGEMIKGITNIQNKQIIDIGCGGGIYTKELALMGAKVLLGLIFQKKYYKLQKKTVVDFQIFHSFTVMHIVLHILTIHSTLLFLVRLFIICKTFLHFYVKLLVY